MKKITNIISNIALLLGVASCSTEAPFVEKKAEGEGRFLTSSLAVELKTDEKIVRSEQTVTANDMIVDFLDVAHTEEPVKSYIYGDMPEVVTLPVGDYIVKAHYGGEYPDGKKAGFNKPYYLGESKQFSIEKDKICDNIGTVVCALSNVKVTINFDKSLADVMSDDAKVSVNVGDSGVLEFYKDTEDSGYFVYDEGSITLSAVFEGMIEGDQTTESKSYSNVKPGNHYKITFKLHAIDPNEPGGLDPGTPGNEIKVDAKVQLEDLTGNSISDVGQPGEEEIYMKDDRYPDDEPENPDDPGIEDPDGPAITAVNGVDLSKWNVNPSACELLITSTTGITGFRVDIISDKLTPDELANVGLAAHFDLISGKEITESGEDGQDLSEGLGGLGFPTGDNVLDQKEVKFDISAFMPMLAVLGAGDHVFKLTVSDEIGTSEKELKIRINK